MRRKPTPSKEQPSRKLKVPNKSPSDPSIILFKDSDDQDSSPIDQSLITPWLTDSTRKISDPLLRFHNEIIDLVSYLQPTQQQHKVRTDAYEYVKNLIEAGISDVRVETFGSFKTKTYLPNSDIDIAVVKQQCNEKKLFDQIYQLLASQPEEFEQITRIRNAKVPLIKLVKTKEKLHMDISINKLDGITQMKQVENAMLIYPELKYLLFLNKCILKQRQLSETYSGGVGSFLLFCMVLCFVRQTRKERKNYSLGQFMLKYLEFYGVPNWSEKRIYMRTGQIVYRAPADNFFSIMNPQDDNHDIGAQAFKIKDVFNVYRNRFKLITNYNFKRGESIVKYLVNPNNQAFTFLKETRERDQKVKKQGGRERKENQGQKEKEKERRRVS